LTANNKAIESVRLQTSCDQCEPHIDSDRRLGNIPRQGNRKLLPRRQSANLNGNSGGQILPDLFTLDITGTPRESMAAARQW
jgi:hypothetical protein